MSWYTGNLYVYMRLQTLLCRGLGGQKPNMIRRGRVSGKRECGHTYLTDGYINDSWNWRRKQKEHVSTGGAQLDAMTVASRWADAKDVVVVVVELY